MRARSGVIESAMKCIHVLVLLHTCTAALLSGAGQGVPEYLRYQSKAFLEHKVGKNEPSKVVCCDGVCSEIEHELAPHAQNWVSSEEVFSGVCKVRISTSASNQFQFCPCHVAPRR